MRGYGRAQASDSIVTSDAVQGRHWSTRYWRRAGLAVGVLIVLIAGGVVTLRVIRPPQPSAPHHQARAAQDPNSALIHPEQGVKDAQAELRKATTQHDKAIAYADLGVAYLNNQQPDQAIAAYQDAIATDSASKVAVLAQLSSAYYANGQTSQAISTMQQLVQLLQQSPDPNMQSQAQQYQKAIAVLEAGGGL
ncbi:MAG TPA: tetratricopeptide repeat protein [Ktedonobacterales bacterium]|jgi:tetratricopeptide (TPR) repeat protein